MVVGGPIWSVTLCLWVLMVAASDLVDPEAGCVPSSCGHIHNISHPFRLKTDPDHCGDSRFTLSCENNVTLILHLLSSAKFYVQAIKYNTNTIRAVDPGIQKNNCSSIPSYSLATFAAYDIAETTFPVYFLKCTNPVNASLYLGTAPCFNSSQPNTHGYAKVNYTDLRELKGGCSIEGMNLVVLSQGWVASYKYIHNALLYGFELNFTDVWPYGYPFNFRGIGSNTRIDTRRLLSFCGELLLGIRSIFGVLPLIVFVIYKWRRRHLSIYNTIEEFLHGKNIFVPIRYSYSNIKKMSNKFKDKLGEGGYGCVFKEKLRSGRLGAIKMLGKPKANGEDFISEIATIGRIHHVNVVQLIGYCVERSKQALVYEFMPNGSLDKYIYSREGSISLSFKQMYEISLGVAKGIEYLHQGCDMLTQR